MNTTFSEHFTYGKLLKFTYPSIIMMIFMSVYTIVDGIFVSNVAGDVAFAALNVIWPVISVISSFGFMVGTGGSAFVAKTLGENRQDLANGSFSLLIYFSVILGAVLGFGTSLFMGDFARMVGATPEMVPDCVAYGKILAWLLPAAFVQNCMLCFVVTADRPKYGLYITLLTGFANIVMDYLFVAVFGWGIAGAALATGLAWVVSAVIPLVYFALPNHSLLRLGRPDLDWHILSQSCLNGSSEMVNNLSMSVIAILYNYILLRYMGSDGVVAYGIIQYLSFIFASTFLGYNTGVSPVFAYNLGAGNKKELHSLLKKSLVLISGASLVMLVVSESLSRMFAGVFVSYSPALMDLCTRAIRIYSVSFMMCGFGIFASGFFTALNNGKISALISFLRTFVFQAVSILLLPVLFGIEGIWNAINVAEGLALAVSLYYIWKYRRVYGY